jgi:K+-sensing histidine kinase KdpD
MGLTIAIFCIAALLSPLAAVMAFLIFYEEYKHHYLDKRKAFKTALEAAIFTLVVFLALGLLLGIILPFCFQR